MLQPKLNFPHPPLGTRGYVLHIFLDDSHLSYTTLIISHNCLGKYYLVDLAYPNTLGYLALYIGKETRRRIPQFRKYDPPK